VAKQVEEEIEEDDDDSDEEDDMQFSTVLGTACCSVIL
jgi:hypothetical protein